MNNPLILALYMVPVLLISLTFHEYSHAYISYKLGDPTAKAQGRLTLNPIKHLDPIGTLMMLIAHIGWAKPVPTNPMYYRDRKKGTMLVSFAGPVSNIIIAIICAIPMQYFSQLIFNYNLGMNNLSAFNGSIIEILASFFYLMFVVNINLAFFNLIPVPPLDGSKILAGVLPQRQYFKYLQYERYIGIVFLLIVLLRPGMLSGVLGFVSEPFYEGIIFITKPIVNILMNI